MTEKWGINLYKLPKFLGFKKYKKKSKKYLHTSTFFVNIALFH